MDGASWNYASASQLRRSFVVVWRGEVLSRSESGAEPGGMHNRHLDIWNGARQRGRSCACFIGVCHRNRINHKSIYARNSPIALRADDGNDLDRVF